MIRGVTIFAALAAMFVTPGSADDTVGAGRPVVRVPRYPDRLYFPDSLPQNRPVQPKRPATTEEAPTTTDHMPPMEIPLDFAMRLNEVENVTEFLREFVRVNPAVHGLEADVPIGNRFGEVERKAVTSPKPAGCSPELHSVSLVPESNSDPTLFYYPTCTRVERCGGCCSHDLLSCQPTVTEIINFQVVVTQYGGMSNLKYIGKEIVPIEQHLKCKCNCIVKREDCNIFQEYRDRECRCVCVNFDDEEKCNADSEMKIWDPRECTCKCREVKECSTGFYHDEKTCRCMEIPITRRRASEAFGDPGRRDIGRFSYKTVHRIFPLPSERSPIKT
ncbi:uncharacterized protein LOC124162403 [Ischnura elegans]|uniref:uncharacterized protein LOC124162403 n=1 Tax=Ischnura elegans TaxID=197161 RepID=UPI001ED8717F|nr:uncharacterized protein LOC124162403 [Ischnura elegans]